MSTRKNQSYAILCTLVLTLAVCGCAAPMDASKAYSRAVINRGAIVPAENIREHEYLNYYEQRFPEPLDQPLALDLRLGNTQVPTSGGEVWLQIGLQARRVKGHVRTPLNLALVLDCSGSMGDTDKMTYLKQSLMVFLQSLKHDDLVSIVGYNDSAWLVRDAQPVEDGAWIQSAVQSLRPGGSTNLHAGMMLGFEQVKRNFDIRRNNRLILLTDGIANKGVTDPNQIASDALAFNQQEIYLSVIGLGLDLDDHLLSTLAQQGRGAYHFVDSAQEMDKVFRKEVAGLVERVANDVRVNIVPIAGVRLTSVTGFEGRPPEGGAQVILYEMGAGDSQVLMARLLAPASSMGNQALLEVILTYTDVFAQREREDRQMVSIQTAAISRYNPLEDIEVHRNATIVRMAEALIEIDKLFNQGRYLQAWHIAAQMEAELRRVAALAGDQQMVEDADLFQRYQMTLSNALGYDPAQSESNPTPIPTTYDQPQRWGESRPTPLPAIGVE
jgi:Ca-activated chloride channel family protein